jgi:hypothetical protein
MARLGNRDLEIQCSPPQLENHSAVLSLLSIHACLNSRVVLETYRKAMPTAKQPLYLSRLVSLRDVP